MIVPPQSACPLGRRTAPREGRSRAGRQRERWCWPSGQIRRGVVTRRETSRVVRNRCRRLVSWTARDVGT
jgi:hypothetical protein